MKWRVLVLLIAGLAMIYLISLLQDTPYPHPVIMQAFVPKRTRSNEPSQVILSEHDGYIYRTHIHYEAVLDTNRGFVHGVDSVKVNVNGLVIQARKKKGDLLKEEPEEEWEDCFRHLLSGPITKVSKSPENSDSVQFTVLFHILENDTVKHFVRVYYLANDNSDGAVSYEYKEILMPGNTMINAISLEQDSILFSRDPDAYRFRIVAFPDHFTKSPHSEKSSVITTTVGQTGDLVRAYHQPGGTESHANLLCKLYSPNIETYRVFTLDIHKTKSLFHTNVTISDGTALTSSDKGTKKGKWILRDHLNTNDSTFVDENLEYMAFVDGAHFHHERTLVNMPVPSISRSKDSKTMVVSLIRNDFQTLDFTDNLSALMNNEYERKYLYKTSDGDYLHEFYHTMQVPDSVEPSDTAFDATDIRGVQLNANGTLLAVWTKANSVYIYKRGSGDQIQKAWGDVGSIFESKPLTGSPHHLEKPLEWILRMVISPTEGQIGSIAPIGAAMFWSSEGSNYLSVGMRNSIVNTYLIDEMEEQKVVNFRSFMRDKWDLWMVMSMIVTIFVVNEYKTYPV
ncbi:Rad2 nuclease [Mucor velutinosus]|uniref:Rad2 nuclease n=1 Tax=Mucor velutinosus TaxID=708070 RepID=A0AAN7HZD7_9FUNG|nr:Rad2 nuclease [Mucor velutinosus]